MNNYRKPFLVITLLSTLIFILMMLYKYNLRFQLKINGAKTNAVITNVNYENYTVNEYDPYTISHYFITYEFDVNHQKYHCVTEILQKDYYNFTTDTLNINDSISVLYLISNPSINKLLPIK